MNFIDTHAHLYLDPFDEDIDAVIDRATEAAVSTIVLPNIDSATINRLHNLTDRYSGICVPLMGLHPTHVKQNYHEELTKIFNRFEAYTYKGVGEIGIDLYWDKTLFNEQVNAFEQQLAFALAKDLPVVIHARESFDEILNIVKAPRYKGLRGIFHAFTGDFRLASEIIGLGFYIGIGGILTFKNSGLAEVMKKVNLEYIVLETDSPFLAPAPYRGKRNESSYVRLIASFLAEIKGESIEKIALETTKNAKQLFRL
jgi:TatD DNase family protein